MLHEVPLCAGCRTPRACAERVRREAESLGLEIVLDRGWAGVAESAHMHFRPPRSTGTLEFTLAAKEGRAWFSWQEARFKPWILEVLPQLLAAVECPP